MGRLFALNGAPPRGRKEQKMPDLLINDENGKSNFTIGGEEIIIGRSDECGLVLKAQAVSRKHSKLFMEGPIYYIADLNSTNGTFVNGVKITEKTALAHRDSIAIGQARIEFYDAEGAMLEDTAIRLAGDFHNGLEDKNDIKSFVDKLIAGIKTVGEKISALNQRIPDTTQGTRALKNTLDIISADIGSIIEENKGVYTAIASQSGKKSEATEQKGSLSPAAEAESAKAQPAAETIKTSSGKDYSRVLEEINDIILKVEDYKKASKFILSVAMKIIGTNRGFIVVKDPTIGSITPLVSEISSGEFAESSPSMLVAKYAINTGETIIVDDPMLDARFMGMSESIVSGIIKSVICLPLIKNGVNLGAIYMDNTQHKRHFTVSDSDFVRALGEKVFSLLEKSGFFGELIDEYEQLNAKEDRIAAYLEQFEKIRTKLIIEGIINETDAEKIIRSIKSEAKSPILCVVDGGIAGFQALEKIFIKNGVEKVDLSQQRVTASLAGSIPCDYALARVVVPFCRTMKKELSLAMADPFDIYTISEIEKHTSCKVEAFYCEKSEIIKALVPFQNK